MAHPSYLRGSFTPVFSITIVLIPAIAILSLYGILRPENVYPNESLLLSFATTDWANCTIGIPLTILALILAIRKQTLGYLLLSAMLGYIFYTYMVYLLTIPFGFFFPFYLTLCALSLYAIPLALTRIESGALAKKFHKKSPARIGAIILLILALFVLLRQYGIMITLLNSNSTPPEGELSLWIADLVFVVPALGIGGVTLWRRTPFGYLIGPPLLFLYGTLAASLIPVMLMQSHYRSTPIDWEGIIVVSLMAILCLLPFAFFFRNTDTSKTISKEA